MELKEYQVKCLDTVKDYLNSLTEAKDKYNKALEIDVDIAKAMDYPKMAWQKVSGKTYNPKVNGINEPLPNFCLKVPTGGGKTLLATRTIDLIQSNYIKRNNGLVLWIVPTNQIYRQTLKALKNREHPYRQVLDITSGGRTLILEKTDKFSPIDAQECLVIMLLMLPSANRRDKETLKIFQDSGGFEEFFPPEDHIENHVELLKKYPNLDAYGIEGSLIDYRQVKTSLGNTLRILNPVIILDEGHKAYSENAQATIRNFNPSMIVELSATPPAQSNNLVSITGMELNREEMIKLDINVTNKAGTDWTRALLAGINRRNDLENKANEYKEKTGIYIRPINLIQVERTGKEQRDGHFTHAEEVREYLVNNCNIKDEEIAIKSSEKDDIEGINLLSPECQIKYIITKQALQEGWDCPFAYVLTVLTNPASQVSITQLVGRILRQPYATKTKNKALDESYIYCFRDRATDILQNIKKGLEEEGLGDIVGKVVETTEEAESQEKEHRYRENFRKFEGKIFLPRFVVQNDEDWNLLSYEKDILGNLNWNEVNISGIKDINLKNVVVTEETYSTGLSGDLKTLITTKQTQTEKVNGFDINYVFISNQISDLIINPWQAYGIAKQAISHLLENKDNSKELICSNFIFIIDELKKILEKERNRLAEKAFKDLIDKNRLCFFIQESTGFKLPSRITLKASEKRMTRVTGEPIQRSLFDVVPENELNDLEKSVALYLDDQELLLWWYRNRARKDYNIQGWQKGKIYADFIFSTVDEEEKEEYSKVYVVETKGNHLENPDTQYKKNVFELCNKLGKPKTLKEFEKEFESKKVEFQVIYQKEWENELNRIFG